MASGSPKAPVPMTHFDVLIVGGGIIGRAIAWQCAKQGLSVAQIIGDVPPTGLAAAGMLAPSFEVLHHRAGAPVTMMQESLRLWPMFARNLEATTGEDIDFRQSGTLGIGFSLADLPDAESISVPAQINALSGLFVKGEGQVDPRKVLPALAKANDIAGVQVLNGRVASLMTKQGQVVGVQLADGSECCASKTIIASGSKSSKIAKFLPELVPVEGRAFLVRMESIGFDFVVRSDDVYICPKADGYVYVGATEESGSDSSDALKALWRQAVELMPDLRHAEVIQRFHGVRPASANGIPFVGASTDIGGLYLAYGHDRNGILLAPWTARKITEDLVASLRPSE